MSELHVIIYAIYAFNIITISAFGLTYLLRNKFMPYHQDALRVDWEQLPLRFQVLILALMRVIGAAAISVCIIATYLLISIKNNNDIYGLYILTISFLNLSLFTLLSMNMVRRHTKGNPPCIIIAGSSIICIVGSLLGMFLSFKV